MINFPIQSINFDFERDRLGFLELLKENGFTVIDHYYQTGCVLIEDGDYAQFAKLQEEYYGTNI